MLNKAHLSGTIGAGPHLDFPSWQQYQEVRLFSALPSFPDRHSKGTRRLLVLLILTAAYSFNSSAMDTPRSSTPVGEPGASESLLDSTRLILPLQWSPSGASSAVGGHTSTGRVQRKSKALQQYAATLIKPTRKVGPPPTAWQSIRAILLASCELFSCQ